MRSRLRRGFSLIELLIVILILGIIAGIVYPHFTTAKEDTDQKALLTQLQTLRRQIELYKAQHDGQLPNLTAGWGDLTSPAPYKGKTLKPYLPGDPENIVNGLKTVTEGDGSVAASSVCGFVYHYAGGAGTGRLFATRGNGTTIFSE